jgi:hypothetical protein
MSAISKKGQGAINAPLSFLYFSAERFSARNYATALSTSLVFRRKRYNEKVIWKV